MDIVTAGLSCLNGMLIMSSPVIIRKECVFNYEECVFNYEECIFYYEECILLCDHLIVRTSMWYQAIYVYHHIVSMYNYE